MEQNWQNVCIRLDGIVKQSNPSISESDDWNLTSWLIPMLSVDILIWKVYYDEAMVRNFALDLVTLDKRHWWCTSSSLLVLFMTLMMHILFTFSPFHKNLPHIHHLPPIPYNRDILTGSISPTYWQHRQLMIMIRLLLSLYATRALFLETCKRVLYRA